MNSLIGALLTTLAIAQPGNGWQQTIDRVVPSVVVMRVSATRSFDDVSTGSQVATGFVVDAEQGWILTNRHVVMPGPVVAEAVFLNNEEVEVRAAYRDPVHDFGFYRFDPADVKFMQVPRLELAPDRAKVGSEIRVIGNDAGEKLAILAGTIARLDRAAPNYGPNTFNDFNTFYIQAASGTSGGSSGSPVIDISGKVVAMNAGGKRMAASSFFLPLDRVQRALDLLRAGKPVARGTLQTVFFHEPFDELRRLGLDQSAESTIRKAFPGGTGMIVVREIVPGGPADGILEPGDILLRVNGKLVNAFLPVEAALDDAVGRSVVLDIERGGAASRVEVPVGDLHAITPSEYLEFGGSVLNPLSYHQARNHAVPIGGVYLANPGYVFSRVGLPRSVVVTHVGKLPTPDLDAFEAVVSSLPDGLRVPIRFFVLDNPHSPAVAVIRVDRRWFDMQRCVRDDATGRWPCRPSPEPPARPVTTPATARFAESKERPVRAVVPSLVMVEYDVPYRIDGVHGDRFQGAGLVVDAERGLVVVDRETVPIALGDLTLVFGGSVQVPGTLRYLHPEHNLAVVQYDPELLGDTPIRSAELREQELHPGDDVWLVGLTVGHRVVSRDTRIARREALAMPMMTPPRFSERNIEVVTLEDVASTVGGVLTDKKGRVLALWASFSTGAGTSLEAFFAGISSAEIARVLEPLREGRPVGWRTLAVELGPLNIADARDRGLSNEQARILEAHDPKEKRVLSVVKLTAGSPSAGILQIGDLLLAIDGKPVNRFHEVAQASMAEEVALRVLRNGEELDLLVPTEPLDGVGTERAVVWAGTLLQHPPRALAAQRFVSREGVYVARYWFGSPADRYNLPATRRILEIDGRPTPDLDAFLAATNDKPDRGSVRIKSVDLDGRVDVTTLKLDLEYWPTYELIRSDGEWHRALVPVPEGSAAP